MWQDDMRPMKVTVIVELKPSVLDPQGKAIQHSLSSLGFSGVEDVRAGKLFRLTLADSGQSRPEVEQQILAVTSADVQTTAADLFRNNRLNVAVITPSKDERGINALLSF